MKRIKLLLTSIVCAVSAYAQLSGDGFYRVQNEKTKRFITVVDNRGSVNVQTTDADLNALRTVEGFERVVSDPASVVYIKKMAKGYDLQSQGMDTYAMINRELMIFDWEDGTYSAYATESGMTKYLCDNIPSWMIPPEERIYGSVCTNSPDSKYWYINPVKNADGSYFGITPDIAVGDSFYKSFYVSFAFSFASSGMKAYYVTKVDAANGCAVVKEVTGTMAPGTPIVVKCSSAQPANNKLNLLNLNGSGPADNLLKGQYFCNPDAGKHTNVLAYNATTMRVLGKAADGSLAFVRQSSLKYIPANTAYLTVASGTPETLKVLTEAEYSQMLAEAVTITANSYTRVYGEANPAFEFTPQGAALKGEPVLSCAATATSPVGKYPIKVAKGSVTNGFTTLADGVLTITPAELTVTVADAVRDEGEENPPFVLTYEGFKNGDTESVLKVKPTATTTATKDSPAGEYDITVSGGFADNYVFSYVGGKLTVNIVSGLNGVKAAGGTIAVYDVFGKRVLSDASSIGLLRKGVYIVNGRKVVVK
ncbi:MAG: hypothetical protein IKQ58_05040 [Prevotella sp.]|nr:hypothetical protein [Prevotella sp.]